MNTLVVDDSKSARFALRKFLEAGGHTVETADSGTAALDLLDGVARAGRRLPEVIFLDHVMPGLDGFETLARLRADEHLFRLPVIICSSNEGDAFVAEARRLGAVGVLQKPPSREGLERMVQASRSWQAGAGPAVPPPAAVPRAEAAPTPGPAPMAPVEASPPYPYPDPAPVAPLPPPDTAGGNTSSGLTVADRLRALRTTPPPAPGPAPHAPVPPAVPAPAYNPLPENPFGPGAEAGPGTPLPAPPVPLASPAPPVALAPPVPPAPAAPPVPPARGTTANHDPLFSPGFAASLGVAMPATAERVAPPSSVSWNLPAPSIQLPDGAASQAEVMSLRDALARIEDRLGQPPAPALPSRDALHPLVEGLVAERMQSLSQQIETHLGQLRAGIEQVLTAQNERIEALALALPPAAPASPTPDTAALRAEIDRVLSARLGRLLAVLAGETPAA